MSAPRHAYLPTYSACGILCALCGRDRWQHEPWKTAKAVLA